MWFSSWLEMTEEAKLRDDWGSKAHERKKWLPVRELGKAGREAGAKAWKGHEKSREGLRKRGKSRYVYKKTKISEYLRINQEKLHIIFTKCCSPVHLILCWQVLHTKTNDLSLCCQLAHQLMWKSTRHSKVSDSVTYQSLSANQPEIFYRGEKKPNQKIILKIVSQTFPATWKGFTTLTIWLCSFTVWIFSCGMWDVLAAFCWETLIKI